MQVLPNMYKKPKILYIKNFLARYLKNMTGGVPYAEF
jgi:hypothetical protein